MHFIDQILRNLQCFPMTKKLRQVFVSKQATKTFKHLVKQSIEISEELLRGSLFRGNQKFCSVSLNFSHMFEL